MSQLALWALRDPQQSRAWAFGTQRNQRWDRGQARGRPIRGRVLLGSREVQGGDSAGSPAVGRGWREGELQEASQGRSSDLESGPRRPAAGRVMVGAGRGGGFHTTLRSSELQDALSCLFYRRESCLAIKSVVEKHTLM